jgi:preprotein translocase subunit SecY
VFGKYANILEIPELRRRLMVTLVLLAIYRIGIFVTVPGVDRTAMARIVSGAGGGVLGLLNLFTGGALQMMSIFALGIMPYISTSIIIQLMSVAVPAIERLQKEGESGRRKINQYTRYGTVLLSIVQGFLISGYLINLNESNPGLLISTDVGFRLMTMLTLTTGSVFMMWLGEQITEHGVGNGISLLITAGIIASFPAAVVVTYEQFNSGAISPFSLAMIFTVVLAVTAFIVFVESAQRRIPLQYAKRMVGRRIYGGQQHHLPLKVNMAGVIPPIFASSLLVFPTTVASYFQDYPIGQWIQTVLRPGDWRYNLLYTALIFFFCFFYTAVQINPVDIADNLKRSGAYVPGIRPGKNTAMYIDEVMSRLTLAGAVYIASICVMPFFLMDYLGVTFFFGGTSVLIVVSVALDSVTQINGFLLTRDYDDLGQTGGALGTTRINEREGLGEDEADDDDIVDADFEEEPSR